MSGGQHEIGASVRNWTDVVRRARFDKIVPGTKAGTFVKGSTVMTVALTMASYADYRTGRRMFPGIARLAADCQIGYSVASRVVVGLRDLGLIERTRRAVRRGARSERERTDEYRLTLPEDLLERLTVPTPSDYLAIAAKLAKPHREVVKPQLDSADLDTPLVTSDQADPAESNCGIGTDPAESNCGIGTDLTASSPAATSSRTCTTSTTSHPGEDVSSDAAATRVGEAASEDPNLEEGESGPPSLRVVTGGGKTTRAQPGLWPAAVPSPATVVRPVELQVPTTGELARAEIRATLAQRRRKTG